jgi:hypothetical protein
MKRKHPEALLNSNWETVINTTKVIIASDGG